MTPGWLKTTLWILLLIGPIATAPSSAATAPREPRTASILAEDWKAIVRDTDPTTNPDAPPQTRALVAQGLLLQNRNNEAFKLFLSLDEPSRQAWRAWALEFSTKHADRAVAHFLLGDALARSGELEGALRSFDIALGQGLPKVPPMKTPVLALIAKGAVLAQLRRNDDARAALTAAVAANDRLAEVHASLGNLMVLNRSYPRALAEFTRATELSRNYVVALNGLGCAHYGQGKWELADAAFAEAEKTLALPLFGGNRRALLVAEENTNMPEMTGSPLFRVSDFLDWGELRLRSTRPTEVMHVFTRKPLPEALDGQLLADLNERLGDPDFANLARSRLDLSHASQPLLEALRVPGANQPSSLRASTPSDAPTVRVLNRLILEHAYPDLIARHTQRNPGMQLTLTKGFVEQMSYKKSLSAEQLLRGQATMDTLLRPAIHLLKGSGAWPLVFLGNQLNDHYQRATESNKYGLASKGIDFNTNRVSGLDTNMRMAFIQEGPWPVVNWFGLAYTTPMEPQQ